MNARRAAMALAVWMQMLNAPSQADVPTNMTPQMAGIPHTCMRSYPEEAMKRWEQGVTILAFRISTDGRTKNLSVSKSSGFPDLDQASLACAEKWLYKPATSDGKPVEVDWKAAVSWTLHTDPKTSMPVATDGAEHVCSQKPSGTEAVKGETILFFTVRVDGAVQDVTVEKSSGSAPLDGYRVSCVSQWMFIPAFRGEQAVSTEWYARLPW
jgi:TonB family protein